MIDIGRSGLGASPAHPGIPEQLLARRDKWLEPATAGDKIATTERDDLRITALSERVD